MNEDLDLKAICYWMIGIIVGAVLSVLVCIVFVKGFDWVHEHYLDQPLSPLAAKPAEPAEPRLQSNPPADMRTFRAQEDAALHSYGWVDQSAGVVRIPIERAMKIVAEESR